MKRHSVRSRPVSLGAPLVLAGAGSYFSSMSTRAQVLVSGASGFVGRHLVPVLEAAGHDVRCGSRDPARASARWPERRWVHLDLEEESSLRRAMDGCDAAYYLVHSISSEEGYPAREGRQAHAFAAAAHDSGLRRVIYLGGVAPAGRASRHLESRLHTGRILRASAPSAIELRASMIVGAGSASWEMVRDLSARLPAMVLPAWARHRSSPVALEDVLFALVRALELDEPGPLWLDVPGPEVMTVESMFRRVAALLGTEPPMVPVPVLSPALSSYWIALVTRVPLGMARELVAGLESELVPSGESIWDRFPEHRLVPFDVAAARALAEDAPESRAVRAVERLVAALAPRSSGARDRWRPA